MSQASTLKVLQHPYHEFEDLNRGRAGMREAALLPGSALVWIMGERGNKAHADLLRTRPRRSCVARHPPTPGADRSQADPRPHAHAVSARRLPPPSPRP